jgi:Domain of unknown function (DUF4136)
MEPMGRIATCTLFFVAMLGTAVAQQVKTDFDHQANFSRYKTYSWQEIKPANSLRDARIKSAADAQLAAKVWTQVDSGGDVSMVAIATSQTERTLQTFYDDMGGGWRWRGFGGMGEATTTEQDYKEGTLVVDMYDAKNQAVDLARQCRRHSVQRRREKEKNLDKSVVKMFKKFRPQAAKG